MKREYFVLGFVAIILIIMVYSNVRNSLQHKSFFNEVTVFKNKGDRNTASMGKFLCEGDNELRVMHNLKELDCDAIYK